MNSPLLILTTGGTIDDLEYDAETDAPRERQSLIPSLLERFSTPGSVRVEESMLKDSAFITQEDRQHLLKQVMNAPEERILITHGTKTMVQTARFLGERVQRRTVVLTGSMTLPREDNGRDAVSSLQFALENILSLPVGVFVAMHGKIFAWDNVRKNVREGKFEEERVGLH